MTIDELIDKLPDLVAEAIQDDWREKIHAQVAPAYQALYEDNANVTVEGGETVVAKLTKKVPNFVEHGLGPHMGQEGPYDIRQTALFDKGRERLVVQVEPGKWRTMSVRGKPWVHPGFQAKKLMPQLKADLSKSIQRIFRRGGESAG